MILPESEAAWKTKSIISSLLILLLSCLVAYWPLTFHILSLKNDALLYFLPVRYQVSEAIQHHYWPFWTPYLDLGCPLHADMQSGVWNPFVQLFSLSGTYTLKTLQYETLLYVYLSGVGMFFFLKYFKIKPHICLLISASYMLCGYNSDSAQFLYWICGTAFLPPVLLNFYRTFIEGQWRYAVYSGFFLYVYFVTAYPADFIILLYLLLAFLIWHLLYHKVFKNKENLRSLFKNSILILVVFILLSLPALLSYVSFLKLIYRGQGVSYELSMSNSLNPLLLFSYITPLAVWKLPFACTTDSLERNSYIGIITFTLTLLAFLLKTQNSFIKFCKWALLIFLIFSFGEIGIIRPITYYLLPLMNTFRHPANAKLFTTFFACILGAFALQDVMNNKVSYSIKKRTLYIAGALILIMILWAYVEKSSLLTAFKSRPIIYTSWSKRIKTITDALTFSDYVFIDCIIQIPFIGALLLFFNKKISVRWLLTAALINCVIHTMLFQPFTVVRSDTVASVQATINAFESKGFPEPDLNATIAENSFIKEQDYEKAGPVNLYSKKISYSFKAITPTKFKTEVAFWNNSKLRATFINYPLLYRADTSLSVSDSTGLKLITGKKVLVTDDSLTRLFIDSYEKAVPFSTTIKNFTPDGWDIEINCTQPGYYCLFQNYHPNWKLFINTKRVPLDLCNISFLGFKLKEGKQLLSFRYEANDIKIAFFISLFFTIIILTFAILKTAKTVLS